MSPKIAAGTLLGLVCLAISQAAIARPWGPMPDRGPGPGPEPIPAPHHGIYVDVLPHGYQTVLIAGLTYFVLNDIWYKLQGGRYVMVDKPAAEPEYEQPHGLTQVDIDGGRYYVRDGRFYRRNADGEYLEVPPPASQKSNN